MIDRVRVNLVEIVSRNVNQEKREVCAKVPPASAYVGPFMTEGVVGVWPDPQVVGG